MKLRSFGVFSGSEKPLEVSARVKYPGPSQVAFVFTGQGAQWYVAEIRTFSTEMLIPNQDQHGPRIDQRLSERSGKHSLHGYCFERPEACAILVHRR
jgi:hypothetical protein